MHSTCKCDPVKMVAVTCHVSQSSCCYLSGQPFWLLLPVRQPEWLLLLLVRQPEWLLLLLVRQPEWLLLAVRPCLNSCCYLSGQPEWLLLPVRQPEWLLLSARPARMDAVTCQASQNGFCFLSGQPGMVAVKTCQASQNGCCYLSGQPEWLLLPVRPARMVAVTFS